MKQSIFHDLIEIHCIVDTFVWETFLLLTSSSPGLLLTIAFEETQNRRILNWIGIRNNADAGVGSILSCWTICWSCVFCTFCTHCTQCHPQVSWKGEYALAVLLFLIWPENWCFWSEGSKPKQISGFRVCDRINSQSLEEHGGYLVDPCGYLFRGRFKRCLQI